MKNLKIKESFKEFTKSKFLRTAFIVFIIGLLTVVVSCKKEEQPKTTYQIINNVTKVPTTIEFLDGTLWEVVVFCYNGTDIIRQDNLDPIATDGGKSVITEVTSNIEKVKISYMFLPAKSPYYSLSSNKREYVVALTTLEKGKNNIITIEGTTMVSTVMVNGIDHRTNSLRLFSFKSEMSIK